jgi:ferredoxin
VLIAGGIGITPISCMYHHLRAQGREAVLHYCARSRKEAAFTAELLGEPGVSSHFDDEAGAPPDLRAFLAAHPKEAHFYCCGRRPCSTPSKTCAKNWACPTSTSNALPPKRWRRSRPAVTWPNWRAATSVTVPAGKSLLDALLDAGIAVDHSCREGVCGACETKVLEGELEHRDGVLSKAERASGKTMMVCVSGCKGQRLVLDL